MRNISPANRYLQLARQGGFHNSDGFFDRDTMTGARGFYADASAAAPAPAAPATPGNKPTSQPFVINVASTSGAAVANFDILGAFQYLSNPPAGWSWDTNGNLNFGAVQISSGVGTINYNRMLAQFQVTPFTVGVSYLKSATANQVSEPLTLTITDATGRTSSNPMLPLIDPYQFQTTVIAFTQKFRMDGNTKITIASVFANASIQIYLYPIDDFNPVRALSNGQIVKSFANPNIVKAQQVFLGQGS